MKMKSLTLSLLILMLGPITAAADPDSDGGSSQPNIVIIMADDLGWNGLGCYGSELAQTPCLDQLAAEGMRFTDAYALSQCLPTRAAIFSGQYGARTGLTSVETSSPGYAPMISPGRPKALEPGVYTLFEMLRDAGYKTGMSGKLHLGGPLNTNSALKNKNRGMEYLRDYGPGRRRQIEMTKMSALSRMTSSSLLKRTVMAHSSRTPPIVRHTRLWRFRHPGFNGWLTAGSSEAAVFAASIQNGSPPTTLP